MSEIKIMRGKKIPKNSGGGRPWKYPFQTMKAGHYFIAPEGCSALSVRNCAWRAAKIFKRKFATRMIDGQLHVWRTK